MYQYEITDTFGGEPNYAWVDRGELRAKTKLGVVRELKRLAGLTGKRCQVSDWGDEIHVLPIGRYAPCIVAFASYRHGGV